MTREIAQSAAISRWLLPRPAKLTTLGGTARVGDAARAWAARGADVLCDGEGILGGAHDEWRVEEVTGGWCSADDREGQGYTLDIRSSDAGDVKGDLKVHIRARSMAGVRAARATLVQLIRASDAGAIEGCKPGDLATCVIEDEPVFARRGVMLDVSRCRVPRMEELFALIDTLSLLKCNHLQLYIEHTFAYSFGEEVWQGWSPITPTELREIDAYCAARGVELAANQNCFGHLRQWLESPGFASLAETHGDWMFDVWPRSGAFSLCPTDPASIAFVRKMLDEMLGCVRGGWVNIGCDETYDIAHGRSKDACARDGREVVYARFVREIIEVARSLGKRSMFWGDIALSNPKCLELIPHDAAVLAWGYEASTQFGEWCEAARRCGTAREGAAVGAAREVWVCPGTSTWRAITGRTRERRGNLDRAAREGAAHGASGFLVCEWGDCGHWQQRSIALRAMADAMDAAWSGGTRESADGSADGSGGAAAMHALGERDANVAQRLGRVMDDLGDADAALRDVCGGLSRADRTGKALPNATAMYADLFQKWDAGVAHAGSVAQWRDAMDRVEDAGAQLRGMRLNARNGEELAHTVTLAKWACARALARRGAGAWIEPEKTRDALKAEHARLWRVGSREGGLAQSLEFFDRIEIGPA
jgi:hexosaminidase